MTNASSSASSRTHQFAILANEESPPANTGARLDSKMAGPSQVPNAAWTLQSSSSSSSSSAASSLQSALPDIEFGSAQPQRVERKSDDKGFGDRSDDEYMEPHTAQSSRADLKGLSPTSECIAWSSIDDKAALRPPRKYGRPDHLPPELLEKILGFVKPVGTKSMAGVNKEMRTLLEKPICLDGGEVLPSLLRVAKKGILESGRQAAFRDADRQVFRLIELYSNIGLDADLLLDELAALLAEPELPGEGDITRVDSICCLITATLAKASQGHANLALDRLASAILSAPSGQLSDDEKKGLQVIIGLRRRLLEASALRRSLEMAQVHAPVSTTSSHSSAPSSSSSSTTSPESDSASTRPVQENVRRILDVDALRKALREYVDGGRVSCQMNIILLNQVFPMNERQIMSETASILDGPNVPDKRFHVDLLAALLFACRDDLTPALIPDLARTILTADATKLSSMNKIELLTALYRYGLKERDDDFVIEQIKQFIALTSTADSQNIWNQVLSALFSDDSFSRPVTLNTIESLKKGAASFDILYFVMSNAPLDADQVSKFFHAITALPHTAYAASVDSPIRLLMPLFFREKLSLTPALVRDMRDKLLALREYKALQWLYTASRTVAAPDFIAEEAAAIWSRQELAQVRSAILLNLYCNTASRMTAALIAQQRALIMERLDEKGQIDCLREIYRDPMLFESFLVELEAILAGGSEHLSPVGKFFILANLLKLSTEFTPEQKTEVRALLLSFAGGTIDRLDELIALLGD